MNALTWVLVTVCWASSMLAIGWVCFRAGYNIGWEERHRDMILPRNIVDRTNRRIDDDTDYHRHTAIDPKNPLWH